MMHLRIRAYASRETLLRSWVCVAHCRSRTSLFKIHRCHKKEFLLKFARGRARWVAWLYEAKRRYGLCVLNYIVTSNHIHLLVLDTKKNVISNSMQLMAGRTAQEYSLRKKRKGSFWEDRYHATAVDTESYLLRCMVYVDLNMVRTGVVGHPSQWPDSGYNEIQNFLAVVYGICILKIQSAQTI